MRIITSNISRNVYVYGAAFVIIAIYLAAPHYALLVVNWIALQLFRLSLQEKNTVDQRILIGSNFFINIILVSVLFSSNPLESSYIVSNFIYYFLALFLVLLYVGQDQYKLFISVLAVTALLSDGYALLQYFSNYIEIGEAFRMAGNRVIGGTSNPILFSGYLLNFVCLFVVQSICGYEIGKSRWLFYLLVTIISAIVLIMTGTRGGWLAFVGMLAFWLMLDYRYSWKRSMAISLTIILFLIGIACMPIHQRLVPLVNEPQQSESARLDMWVAAGYMFLDHPLYGIGLNQYGKFYDEKYGTTGIKDTFTNAHNDYLNFLAETGLQGLLAYLFVLGTFFHIYYNKYIMNRNNIWALTIILMIVCLIIEGLSYGYFWKANNMRLFFIIIGLCMVAERQELLD